MVAEAAWHNAARIIRVSIRGSRAVDPLRPGKSKAGTSVEPHCERSFSPRRGGPLDIGHCALPPFALALVAHREAV